jgi:hypothetical protein
MQCFLQRGKRRGSITKAAQEKTATVMLSGQALIEKELADTAANETEAHKKKAEESATKADEHLKRAEEAATRQKSKKKKPNKRKMR